jgi:zinc protease
MVQKPGRRLRIVDKPERTQTQIMIGRLGTSPADADHTALIVGNAVFGGTFTSRLMRAVRSERGWSYGASSRLGLDRTREAFNVWTFPQASDAAACAALELQLLEELYEKGITQDELTFAQSYLAKSFAFSTDTADKRLEQAVDLWLYALSPDYFSRYVQRIQHVTRDEVNAAIAKRLSPAELTLAAVATDADIGDALRALPGLTEVQVVPFDADATA